MNKFHKVIWSNILQNWVVVSELSTSTKKKASVSLWVGFSFCSCFASAADITCNYADCNADGDITVSTSLNLNDNWYTEQTGIGTVLNIGNTSESEVNVVYGGELTTSLINVGKGGEGTLNIINGGGVNISDYNYSYPLSVGNGYKGTINVNGNGSFLNYNLSSEINIGNSSPGYLNISDGGKFTALQPVVYVGGRGGGQGEVNVFGPNSVLDANRLYIGVWGNGKLEVTDSGVVNISNFSMGYNNSGETIVSGTGSQLNITNSLNIVTTTNINARGTLIINNGGKVTADTIVLGSGNFNNPSTGVAEVLIGGEDNNIIQEAGMLDAGKIIFRGKNTSLTLNHASDNFNLSSDINTEVSYSYFGSINAVHGLTTLSGNNSGYNGTLNISSPARISVTEQNNLGNATIANDGTLSITSQGNWTFSNTMTGLGFLDVNTGNNTFSFQNATNTAGFRGTLMLSDTSFDLSGDNTAALTSSLLCAGSGSMVTVGAGTQNIDGLGFNGGTVDFGKIAPGKKQSNNMVHVSSLDLQGGGAVWVDASGDVIADTVSRDVNTSLSLLEQDDENAAIQLVSVSGNGRVVGSAGGLQLQDQSGQRITDSIQHAVIQNGQKVAEGTYDYRLTSGTGNDGLYIGYGLTQLNLLATGDDALVLNAGGRTGNAADMSARITGSGDLVFNSQKGETVSLSNQNNDYTGVTDIRGGNVLMNSNSALGQTTEIRLAADTQLDMNGHSQTAGKLNGAAGSVLNINGGNLTLTEGGVSAGTLTGSGSLNLSSGEFSITGASSALTATTMVGEKATVKVHDNDSLGTGTVNTAGTLILGNADAPVMLASSQVNIAKDGILTGFGGVSGNVTNSGTLDLRADAPGNVLTVGGNYTGNNGTLLMNTVLGDDSSATDKLVIKGDASGQTRVAVTNAGGTGAQTLNGIELIHVDGNADSAEFVQAGRIAAGAYDYTLGRGQGSNSGNWYLTSGKNTPDPLPNPDPEPTPTPDPDSKPEPAPGGYDNDLRPEAGSYTANMAAANTMFVTRLHDRLGPVQYTDVMTGETKNTSMWMRHEGGHNRWHDGTGQLKTQGNRYVVQLGGDIAQWGRGETDRWHLGVMAGYGNDHNNTDSVRTGYRSKGSVNGYSTGLYATWFANDETHNGAYLDTWAQYGWFDNHVKGDGLPGESWKSKGLTASLETGYTWKAGEFSGSHGSLNEWYVQPQAQVVWMGVKADEHRESNGTRVESTGDGNVRTRLGVKTWIKGHNRMDDGKSREFRPFVEVNWLHNTRDFGTRMNGVTVHQDGARNIGEVKAGVEGQINDRLNLWGNVGVQAGDKGYSDTSAMLGVKYTF
ncbi:TPA: autotransporter outer membrane beta-barrel domain-containing protein [Escherichia coli]|nr:autotransporter outer membrane beta-barrel domain-containing protein [Escherichia coli]